MYARLSHMALLASASALIPSVSAITVNWGQEASIKEAAATAAFDMVSWYTGNETGDVPGNLPDPYYWYQCGAMFNTLLDYWQWTGDDTYNDMSYQGMLHQAGPDRNYRPDNQSTSTANDDQGYWAMMAMSAVEYGFQDPPDDEPQWLALVQAVFNEYVSRWDTKRCGGGLVWQINPWSVGAHYKNSVSNGCFFNVASRLYRYTGDEEYKKWADKVWGWMTDIKFISPYPETGGTAVYDGAGDGEEGGGECKPPALPFFTYNAGIFLHGAAVMYSKTQSQEWLDRLTDLITFTEAEFFMDGVMYEAKCENAVGSACDEDQTGFKATLIRYMAYTAVLVPEKHDQLMGLIASTAKKAATTCTGTDPEGRGHPGTVCSSSWLHDGWDNISGFTEQMNAVMIFASNLVENGKGFLTADTGGTSQGDKNAGVTGDDDPDLLAGLSPITTGDRAGAGILTALALGGLLGGIYFVVDK